MRLGDLDALKKALDEQMNFEENCRDSVFEIIDNAPTVDISETISKFRNTAYQNGFTTGLNKIPQGEWGKWVVSEIRCPNCLEYFNLDCYSKEELDKCPNCGTKLRDGVE